MRLKIAVSVVRFRPWAPFPPPLVSVAQIDVAYGDNASCALIADHAEGEAGENRWRLSMRQYPIRGRGRSCQGGHLPLHRLSNLVRLRVSHGRADRGEQFSAAVWCAKGLRQGR